MSAASSVLQQVIDHSPQQLSIYPSALPPVVLVADPSPLEPHVKVVRETVSDILGDAKAQVDIGVDHWVRFERRVERKYPVLHWLLRTSYRAADVSQTD